MGRWQPGARERLMAAALERFATDGFERTTVAQIADAAGVTERTFFRYFTDKREVLFTGQDEFDAMFLAPIDAAAEADLGDPMAVVARAVAGAGAFFAEERRPWSRARQAVIEGEPALQERELLKMSAVADALTHALTRRGVDPVIAALAAQTGVTAYRVAFAAWVATGETRSFGQLLDTTLANLRGLLATP